jgi:MoxR-like ATPase
MFRIRIEYPDLEAEKKVARRVARSAHEPIEPVLGADEIEAFRKDLQGVVFPEALRQSVVTFVRRTRPDDPESSDYARDWIAFGASPRAAQALAVACRARALLHGRTEVSAGDVRALAPDIVRHRLILNYHAQAEGMRAVEVVRKLLADHMGAPA